MDFENEYVQGMFYTKKDKRESWKTFTKNGFREHCVTKLDGKPESDVWTEYNPYGFPIRIFKVIDANII